MILTQPEASSQCRSHPTTTQHPPPHMAWDSRKCMETYQPYVWVRGGSLRLSLTGQESVMRTCGTMVGCRAANHKVGSSNPTRARSVSLGKKLNSLACVYPALFQGSPMDGSAPDCIKKGWSVSSILALYKSHRLIEKSGKSQSGDSLICHDSST